MPWFQLQLADATVRAAIRFAAVPAHEGGSIPATVAALTEGVLKSMIFSSLKITVLVPLFLVVGALLGGLAAGTGLLAQQTPTPEAVTA